MLHLHLLHHLLRGRASYGPSAWPSRAPLSSADLRYAFRTLTALIAPPGWPPATEGIRIRAVRRIKYELHEAVYGAAVYSGGTEMDGGRLVQALLNEAFSLEQSVAGYQLSNPDRETDLNPHIQMSIRQYIPCKPRMDKDFQVSR